MVLISSCAAKPPQETGAFKPSDLVELQRLDPTIQLDIRYATSKNLVGRPVYTEARAFLQRPAAEALARVNKELEPLGYRLLIFDGYRPWSVTKVFWDITPKGKREFVANPKKGSRHNRGCAVDLSLWDIAAAKEVQMTGEYDEMSPRSYANYPGGTPAQRALRDLLRSKMEQNGFAVLEAEWWHFDYQDWKSYRIQNVPFNKI
ncbi:M15 family metallopeptidase [Hymenobacter sp. BT770]|uniref:M15 family metallopeptidase n=1 Tax=Hymenobacter sp. BT770 TaxID=2886942 RepID=UPI0026735C43|nr:M15 family metallopeptidase [Hymenobacter sp. BT770]